MALALKSRAKEFIAFEVARQLSDPIKEFNIGEYVIFAYANEHITRYFSAYQTLSDELKYNDFFFIKHINRLYGSCHIVDIGTNYGQDLILLCGYKKKNAIAGSVYGFEPNPRPFDLAVQTFLKNGFDVSFKQMALGNSCSPIILSGKKNNSEDMRTTEHNSPDVYAVVPCVTGDSELAPLMDKPVFIKIDTQGAEWLVMQGMTEIMKKPDIIVRIEFLPYRTFGIGGEELLAFYLTHFIVIDAITHQPLDKNRIPDFCRNVGDNSPYGFTDLYLVPLHSKLTALI